MTTDSLVQLLPLMALSMLLLFIAGEDAMRFTIRNGSVLGVVGLYGVWLLVGGWTGLLPALFHISTGTVLLIFGLGLFASGLLGAGDGKLLAALGLWAGPSLVLQMLIITTIAGGGVALTYLFFGYARGSRQGSEAAAVPLLSKRVPYGIALSVGGLWLAAQLGFPLIPYA